MTEQVLVRIKGIQTLDGEQPIEPIELVTAGRYVFREGVHYVRYEEMLEENGAPTVNLVKLQPAVMEVNKKGMVNVQMVFEKNVKHLACYTTPFGSIRMGISTTLYRFRESGKNLEAEVHYVLEMNEEHAADCALHMEILSKDSPFVI